MEKYYTVAETVKMTGVKSYVLRYWEEELDMHIGRTQLGHRCYTEDDIQLFLNIKELKNRGLQLRAIKELLPKIAMCHPKNVTEENENQIQMLEQVVKDAENTSHFISGDEKILEFQEILERLIHEEMQRKKEGEYRCRSLDEAIRKKQQARREAAASCEGKKNKRNRKGCR